MRAKWVIKWAVPPTNVRFDANSNVSARDGFGLELHLLQIGVRREPSRFIPGVGNFTVDNNVKLAGPAGLYVDRSMPVSFDPGLHTEGFGFVASVVTVINCDRHQRGISSFIWDVCVDKRTRAQGIEH